MPNLDEVSGVFDVIDTEEHVAPQPKPTETKTEKPTPAPTPKDETTPEAVKPKTNTDEAPEDDEDKIIDEQDFSRPGDTDEAPTETNTEPSQTETKTETQATPEIDWVATLPPPPPVYNGVKPEVDPETGQLKNMTALEYAQYIEDKTLNAQEHRNYARLVETKALEAAEQILPELKTNQAVRTLVENARTASIIDGNQIDSYEAAKLVREALGLAPAKIQAAKTEGIQSAKTSITVQKRAAVETTGATQKQAAPSKADKLSKRLKSGDDSAFEELFDIMQEEGKI